MWARISRSKRATFGVVVLALLALLAIFAEVVAAPAPIASIGPRGLRLFPAVVDASTYEGLSEADIALYYEEDHALWPLVRLGPNTPADAGSHAPSTRAHPLGTDAYGRDLLARVVYGARTALGL